MNEKSSKESSKVRYEKYNKPIDFKNDFAFADYAFYGPRLIKSANVKFADISKSVNKYLESPSVSKIELTKAEFQIDTNMRRSLSIGKALF